jgi:hypothetical protein
MNLAAEQKKLDHLILELAAERVLSKNLSEQIASEREQKFELIDELHIVNDQLANALQRS